MTWYNSTATATESKIEAPDTMSLKMISEWKANEAKSKYEIYHNSYSSAVDTAIEYAKSQGYEVDHNDVWDKISVGPPKPKAGYTNKASVGLIKDGKPQNKAMNMQIYGMDSGRYELNVYIN